MIKKIEFLKLLKNPFLWMLLLFFLLFNTLIIHFAVGNSYTNQQFRLMYDIVVEHGISEIDVSDIQEPSEEDYEEYGPNRSVMDFFYKDYVETYGNMYETLNMGDILEKKLGYVNYEPKGRMKEFLLNNYKKLQKRVEQIRESGEGSYGFYPGKSFEFHSTLYCLLGRKLMLEMILLSMLSVLYIMDFERIHKTRDIVLSTRTGKSVMISKIFAGTILGIVFSFLLLGGSLFIFFRFVPFQEFWKVPVSSSVAAEPRGNLMYPYITYMKLTEGQYLICTCLIYLGIVILTIGLTVAVQLMVQNSFFSFGVIAIGFMAFFQIAYFHTGYILDVLLLLLNPVALYLSAGGWFMENDILVAFHGYELLTLICSAVWILVLVFAGKKRYVDCEFE